MIPDSQPPRQIMPRWELNEWPYRPRPLRKATDRLDGRHRAVVTLRFYGGVSQAEAARRLNMSQMQVSGLERAALQRLRALLG